MSAGNGPHNKVWKFVQGYFRATRDSSDGTIGEFIPSEKPVAVTQPETIRDSNAQEVRNLLIGIVGIGSIAGVIAISVAVSGTKSTQSSYVPYQSPPSIESVIATKPTETEEQKQAREKQEKESRYSKFKLNPDAETEEEINKCWERHTTKDCIDKATAGLKNCYKDYEKSEAGILFKKKVDECIQSYGDSVRGIDRCRSINDKIWDKCGKDKYDTTYSSCVAKKESILHKCLNDANEAGFEALEARLNNPLHIERKH